MSEFTEKILKHLGPRQRHTFSTDAIKKLCSAYDELENLVKRCDGYEGVRFDGSNIDTQQAHQILDNA